MLGTGNRLVRPVSRFQRAIHVRYDRGDAEIISQYISTDSSATAIKQILANTRQHATQRAHVLHAAYGSGKSHLAVALAALLENDESLAVATDRFMEQLAYADERAAALAAEYRVSKKRLFPVILSGNEGDFGTSILRALARSTGDAGLADLQLATRFDAAIQTLHRWYSDYPEVAERFGKEITRLTGHGSEWFIKQLQDHDAGSYRVFEEIYAALTAGASFDPTIEQAPELVFRDVASQLRGYSGIVVIWDEFGRYLEGHASHAFGKEAALLQDFAETCNHSADDQQIHLILLTHKELQGYAAALPQSYQQEWSRIEGRFQKHNITTNPAVAYRLIAAAIQRSCEDINNDTVERHVRCAHELQLFGMLADDEIRDLIKRTFPLHPLAVFALAQVSSRVAQNERTMFTFLTADEPHSLFNLIEHKQENDKSPPVITIADLWDYFAEAVRNDIGGAGVRKYWNGVVNALDKVAADDMFAQRIVKSLGILSICSETRIRPEIDVLSWSVDAFDEERQDVEIVLNNLRRRKALIFRKVDGYWSFITGSDIDFEKELRVVLNRSNPTLDQLRRLLDAYVPPPTILARRYNQEFSMIRFFEGIYRWADEIENAPWDLQLRETKGDGLVVYLLATNDQEWQAATKSIQSNPQVVYVLPREDKNQVLLSLRDHLRELFALQEINNDPKLRNHGDHGRIQREISWLLEDAEGRLQGTINNLIDPRNDKSLWIRVKGRQAHGYALSSLGQATKIISDICKDVFPATPEFNSEGLNRSQPTSQQARAAQTVIDALFVRQPSATFGLEGYGPEVLALNSILKLPGILRKSGEDDRQWDFGRPEHDERLAEIWDVIEDCVVGSNEQKPIKPLIDTLTQPPFGIRCGIIPLLLGAVLREKIKVTTVWKGRSAVGAVSGETIYRMVDHPEDYSIKVGEWNPSLEFIWTSLLELFDNYILDIEREHQPLTMMSAAMLRWLQALPAFCRDTRQISEPAIEFRNVIRQAIRQPAEAIFEKLPSLIGSKHLQSKERAHTRIDGFMQEISNAYLDLQRRLDLFVGSSFTSNGRSGDALITLKSWLADTQIDGGHDIKAYKFGSMITQDFVGVVFASEKNDGHFWNNISEAVVGIQLRDWNDESESRFRQRILTAREEVERDVQDLIDEDKAITFSIEMPESSKVDFRFRSSDLSPQGQRILQNFKSTMQVAGRPLSIDERRKVALAFIVHIMGEELE